MASLKEFRNRIASVKSTQKITKAMQMVAASKLRKAQEKVEESRPYAERMGAVVANLALSVKDNPDAPELLSGRGEDQKHLLVVMTADRGLCGGFNGNIVRRAREQIRDLQKQGKKVQLFLIGRKGGDLLKRLYDDLIIKTVALSERKAVDSRFASEVAEDIVMMYERGDFDICTLIFSRFESVLLQKPQAKTLIPASRGLEDVEHQTLPDLKGAIYEYEPDEASILNMLLPRYLTTQILSAFVENAAGEMGARMTAMDNATRNAGDMIHKLTLEYNRTRQAMITKELIEIISGAESL